jgi:hypothetical protein
MSTPDPSLRAGDRDRDDTIAVLREAYAEGRLTSDEFQQRLGQAQSARTFGELAVITTDLPAMPALQAPSPTPVPVSQQQVEVEDTHNVRNGWASWVGVSVLVNVIWAASWISDPGSPPYYWPIWVMGPWGAAMLIATLSKRDR